jgi:uroporphyrinogen decarboxylase
MTHKERFLHALNREPVDLIPHGDGLWGEARKKYVEQGKLTEDEDATIHFDMSWRSGGGVDAIADLDFEDQIVEETDETILRLNGNGATLRWWKNKSGTPEHVDFKVKDKSSWEKFAKPFLLDLDRRRINLERYRERRNQAAEEKRAFCWAGLLPFEQMHPLCGHEYMLMGMALEPEWVKDMVMTYADLVIRHLEIMFAEEGLPDAMFFYEDMGFKGKPFMSPAMYRELIQPGHKKLFDYSHDHGLKAIVHSCGFVEPLVPGLVEAGMDCLQAMEVKAGMDMPRIAKQFGDRIAFFGNIDIRILATNDFKAIDEELNRKILPILEMDGGYILHSDHSIPPEVEHDTLEYFFQHGRRITERFRARGGKN